MHDLAPLLTPINEQHPSGTNVEDSVLFDNIRLARESDETFLNQGEWNKELKQASWSEVIELCKEGLTNQSKDLMLVAYFIEAWTWENGFKGAAQGFRLLHQIAEQFWDSLFPEINEDGLEYRAARIAWLNKTLPEALQSIPMVDKHNGSYGLWRWFEVLQVENLERKNPELAQQAQNEGKINKKMFEDAVQATSYAFYQGMLDDVDEALSNFNEMETYVDSLFTDEEPPCLTAVRDTLNEAKRLVVKIYEMKGLNTSETVEVGDTETAETSEAQAMEIKESMHGAANSTVMTRHQALSQLRKIATFFRQNEPHTPVAPLLDKAVKWAEMPFSDWLTEVIKDDGSRSHVSELLGVKLGNAENHDQE